MKVKCIKSVIMEKSKEEAFTEGQVYTIYKSTYQDEYETFPCIRAKNNMKNRHVILSSHLQADVFFENHFKLTV